MVPGHNQRLTKILTTKQQQTTTMADESPTEAPSLLTLLLSRHTTSGTNTVSLTALLRTPHRRSGLSDPLHYELEYLTFLDSHNSGFPNLDALLTRLRRIDVVYLGCCEDCSKGGKHDMEVLMRKIAAVIESREDIAPSSVEGTVVKILPFLNKNRALQLVDQSLPHLLGGESSPYYLSYRGDKRIASEDSISWALGLFFSADPAHSNVETVGLHSLQSGTLTSRVSMDRTAAEAIHLLPPRNGVENHQVGGNSGNNSLYGVLNQCLTKMGSRLLEVWLRQPLVDLKEIENRHSAVAALVDDGIGRDRLRDDGLMTLKGLDVDGLAYQLSHRDFKSTSKALECLYKMHLLGDQYLPKILEVLEPVAGNAGEGSSLRDMYEALELSRLELAKAVELAELAIDFDAAPREFLVNPNNCEDLAEIKNQLNEVEEELQQIHDDFNDQWARISNQQNQVRLEDVEANSNTSCVWQFRLPKSNDIKILQQHTDAKVHRILKNGVYFSTKELEQLGTKKRDLIVAYQERQRDLVDQAMGAASSYSPVLERTAAVLSELDVLASFAYVAAYSPNGYCRPEMTDGEEDGLGIQVSCVVGSCCYILTAITNAYHYYCANL
jgi:DNA mismatch repair protein MSH2